jgi:thiamine pyrophosphokinase
MKKVILVGAGPIIDDSFLRRCKDCFFVACDGGYVHFLNQGMTPDLFVGDFDTLDPKLLSFAKEVIRLNTIKDDTDTIYAIKKCFEKGFDTFYLYGCLGGKIEHTISNIQTLSFLLDRGAKGYLIDEKGKEALTMIDDDISFSPLSEGMISVFSHTDCSKGVNIENLMYTLENATLTSSFPLGVSNQFIKGKKARISVNEGKLVIITDMKNFDGLPDLQNKEEI